MLNLDGLNDAGMRFEQPTADLLLTAARMATASGVGMPPIQIEEGITAGRLQPRWSQLAVDADGSVVGRALWWGRDHHTPLALDVWDAHRDHPSAQRILTELLVHGHTALASDGIDIPLPHTMRVPTSWRDVEAVRRDVDMKTSAAATAGLVRSNERRQFQWDASCPTPPEPHRLRFEAADDDAFVRLFARATAGSLDVMTRRELATTDVETFARAEVDFYRSCPGDRGWWRVAYDGAGDTVGIAIPSATPTSRNVGYLAVLPEHRGHGYVDDLLAYVTSFHVRDGASRITATTDAVNSPMAGAFDRAGYRWTETRIDLER